MHKILPLALVLGLAVPAAVEARLFYQTYGAVVSPPDGGPGCVWNYNSDYFVPRTCDSCRYGLFSPCKSSHSLSPACKYLHPIYQGYCTPFGPCRYKWRDHVYKEYCGCNPLKRYIGPWHFDKCLKHCWGVNRRVAVAAVCAQACCGCFGQLAATDQMNAQAAPADAFVADQAIDIEWLPNVEPFGGESLGTIEAFPAGLSAAAAARGPGSSGPAPAPASVPGTSLAPPTGGAAFTIPGIFGN